MKPAMPPRSERDNAAAREHGLALNAAALVKLPEHMRRPGLGGTDWLVTAESVAAEAKRSDDWLQVEP